MKTHRQTVQIIEAMERENKFALWMHVNRIKYGYTYKDIADKLHTTKQTISNHINGRTEVPFVYCMAYCSLFKSNNDPEEIWRMANEMKL